jgi:hypothetical protein
MAPSLVTNLHNSAHANKRRDKELSISCKGLGEREGGKGLKSMASRLGSRNGRRSAPLRSVTTARRERGRASPETVRIGLTGKYSGEDGSDDEEKGQAEDCEPMHGGEDVTGSWGVRVDALERLIGVAWWG